MANANITAEQRDSILQVTAALFNAAPGGLYLNDMALAVQGGMTQLQLAEVLTNHPVFVNDIMGGRVTSADKVDLLMKNFGLTADSNAASAGSQAKAYFDAKFAAGDSMAKIVVDAITYLKGTVAPEFETTKNLFLNKVAVAAPYSLQSNSTDLNVLQNAFANVKGDHAYSPAEAQQIANDGTASTFVLTDGTDNITGTAVNDIVIGDSKTMQTGDQVNLGTGVDTLKIVGVIADFKTLPTMTGVETVQVVKADEASSLNLTNYTKALTGITTLQVDDATDLKDATTTDGQSLSLATAAGSKASNDVTWTASAKDTTVNLTLNGYQGAAASADVKAITIAGTTAATTQNVASTGAANQVSTLTLGDAVKTLAITGNQDLTVATAVAGKALTTIDASAATGDVNLAVGVPTKATFAFTGGKGDDTIKFDVKGIDTLTSGAQLNGGDGTDTLALSEAAALTAAQVATINKTQGFETLGFAATGSGVDIATITNSSITGFKVLAAAGDQTFTNGLSTSKFIIDNSAGSGVIKIGNKVGEDTTNVTLDSGNAAAAVKLGELNLTGITKLNLTSTGSEANEITKLVNVENSTIKIDGDADLTLALATATTTGSKVDANAFTGDLTVTGTDKNDIIIGGSGKDTINGGDGSDTLTGGAGDDEFDASSVTLGAGTFTTITDFAKGDSITFVTGATGTGPTKIDLTGVASETAALDKLAAGAGGNIVTWGTYNGQTYVLNDGDAGATFKDSTDQVVKLTGTVDLSAATIDTGVMTLG